MDRVAPDVSNSAWGHKYFALLFPAKLDDYHVESWQRYQLVRSLQLPPALPGRYVCGGRYVSLARELEMPIQHLTSTLNRRNGGPHRYWRVGTRSGSTGESQWEYMRDGQYVSIGWAELGDLSGTRLIQESKDALENASSRRIRARHKRSAGSRSRCSTSWRLMAPASSVLAE